MQGGYVDDPTIADEEVLLRRIPRWHFHFDKNLGRWRPSSAAFEDHPDGSPMSVHLISVLEGCGFPVESILADHDGYVVAGIVAGFVRANGQGICRKPRDNYPAHAKVVGPKTERIRKRFAKESSWVINPPVYLSSDPCKDSPAKSSGFQ